MAAKALALTICPNPPLPVENVQVQLLSSNATMSIRQLDSALINKFVRIPGIVVSASTVISRPVSVAIQCRSCRLERQVPMVSGFGTVTLPRSCPGQGAGMEAHGQQCPRDPYVVLTDRCRCVDQQTLKLQEAPEMVPVGELPRQVLLTVDRHLVNRITPGTRLIVNGAYSIFQHNSGRREGSGAVAIRSPYIRVLGIQLESSHGAKVNGEGEEEERAMIALSRQPDFAARFTRSIAPSIFGNEDVKKAIGCLLFGGSRKQLVDGIRLRGDINVLLLGDPGVAKSQLLKFVERVAPISVYTSGKGSSAAGLTASVIRDPGSGEFYLEGGAMVLADGGVVCIDEFDKMDAEDRVAIHEAMEQQTISIAKAGITTILNSRTSVLAAANPVFGRYDEMRTPGEDEHSAERDMTLARHVIGVHMNSAQTATTASNGEMDLSLMRRYISYARTHCSPRLTPEAAAKLSAHYVAMRGEVKRLEAAQGVGERSTIPITVRQLEAIIRIAESLAKQTLSPRATEAHVDEAIRLFRVSTMQAVMAGHSLEGMLRPDLLRDVERVERAIKQRLPIGSSTSYGGLVRELVQGKQFPEHAVMRAIEVMVQQEKLMMKAQRKVLVRQK